MSDNYNDSPRLAPDSPPIQETSQTTDSPRPLCNRGGRLSRRCPPRASGSQTEEWGESMSPDTLPALREPLDDSREGRLKRLLQIPGVTTADKVKSVFSALPGFGQVGHRSIVQEDTQ